MAVLDWDPDPYPDPRKNRKPPTTAPVDQGVIELPEPEPPKVRLWAFHGELATGTLLRQIGSPMFKGPAIIKTLVLQWTINSGAGLRAPLIGLHWMPTAFAESSLGLVNTKNIGTSIWELRFGRSDTITKPTNEGLVPMLAPTTGGPVVYPINFPLYEPDFGLAVYIECPTNVSTTVAGWVQVYEKLDRATMARFMV